MYKVDLSRAYRQLRSDPLDWPLLGIGWQGESYVDISVPFGLRQGASACQRTTEAVVQIAGHEHGVEAEPYVDDTAGASVPHEADGHYGGLLRVMENLGLVAAPHKSVAPCTILLWIGVLFNSITMSMSIDPIRIAEALEMCHQFMRADTVTYKHMQTFLGKVFHVIKCSPPARRFTARLLDLFRSMSRAGEATISYQAKLDTAWMLAFLPAFNGVTLIKAETADHVAQVDACPVGAGGICDGHGFYRLAFPEGILQCHFAIAALECFNVLVACRLWCKEWAGKRILLLSDNWATVCAANSGSAVDPLIRAAIREIWWLSAVHDVDLVIRHRPGAELVTADALSRAELSREHEERLRVILANSNELERNIPMELLSPPLPIQTLSCFQIPP